jgi:hypothetical protein
MRKGDPSPGLILLRRSPWDQAIEEACGAITGALAIRRENGVGPILRRAREVRASLERWHNAPLVRDLDEQLHVLLSAQ